MIRKAVFANDWYPGDPDRLLAALKSYVREPLLEEHATAVVSPHAGYHYSGHVAGEVYRRACVPDTVVVLCVNHHGLGARASILCSGFWETPLGRVPIEQAFAERLLERVPFLEEDPLAHSREHSLEMQVPFLQYRNPEFRLVPICLQRLDYTECSVLGKALAAGVRESTGPVLLVASTDMTHFEPQEVAERKDRLAIERILAVDPRGLYETVTTNRISMCGFIPTTVVLRACRDLNALQGKLVRYATSGDVSGDRESVVGYAGILIS